MSELPRIVVKVEQHAVDKQWPFAEWTVNTRSMIYRSQEEVRRAKPELEAIMSEAEAGVITVYLETPVDTSHSVVRFGQVLSSESATRTVLETVQRWTELYLPGGIVTH